MMNYKKNFIAAKIKSYDENSIEKYSNFIKKMSLAN